MYIRKVEVMANSLVQFRIDEKLRSQANNLCERLGMDLSTYVRMSIVKFVQKQGIPFDVQLKPIPTAEETLETMWKISENAKKNGTSEMTLEEINEEIAAVREGR